MPENPALAGLTASSVTRVKSSTRNGCCDREGVIFLEKVGCMLEYLSILRYAFDILISK